MTFVHFRRAWTWVAYDALAAMAALAAASTFRDLNHGTLATIPLVIALLAALGHYNVSPRYMGSREAVRFLVAVAIAGAALSMFGGVDGLPAYGAASLFTNGFLVLSGLGRAVARRISISRRRAGHVDPIRTLIVGAGDAAEVVLRDLARQPEPSHRIVALLDDDPAKLHTRLHGVPVVGVTASVQQHAARLRVAEILIAIPSADGAQMRDLLAACQAPGVKVRTLPGLSDLLTGIAALPQARQVAIEDLLRRRPAPVDSGIGASAVRGKTVLITGGGGSIGTEVARQIARLGPAKLVLLGRGENSLFEARQRLLLEGLIEAEVVVADVRDVEAINMAFRRLQPDVVFHAAAHKHVPMMESQPIEAFRNNVLGTRNVLRAALEVGTERFTLVSTDKAVRPGNVMGATKRMAELLTIDVARRHRLAYAAVRFGNVLNSRGSLVPSLIAQMAHGGPVRITDERMTRYFMTIPEAAGLIVHAGASAEPGAIYILDMGEPVRIVDLANDLIRLHGYVPNVTMPIVVTGARPGEKLHEELVYDAEELWPTSHPSIRAAMPSADEAWGIGAIINRMAAMADAGDAEGVRSMLMCPPQVFVSSSDAEPQRLAA